MSEDRFFQQVKSVMSDYRPEVPGNVYEGVRKKMWWSNFLRFDATRLNIWYVVLAVGVTTAVVLNVNQTEAKATDNGAAPMESQAEIITAPTNVSVSNVNVVNANPQPTLEAEGSKKIAAQTNAPETSNVKPEETITNDGVIVETTAEAEQPKVEEPQHIKSDAQAPAKGNKRGLKVKTYSSEGDKK